MISHVRKFFTPSTAKAIKGFQKATSQLRRVAELEDAEGARQEDRMVLARDASYAAYARSAEASRIADKLDALLA